MALDLFGIIPPMISPLLPDERVDRDAVVRVANHLIDHGVDGLFLLGSGGEGPVLLEAERDALIDIAVQAVASRVPVLAGCMATSTLRALTYIESAAKLGADVAVVTSSFYYGAQKQSVHIDHFGYLAERSPLPIMIYNIPQTTHNDLDAETMLELAAVPNIIGVKDSSGNTARFQRVLAGRPSAAFKVFQGSEQDMLGSLQAGADGLVAGSCNVMVDAVVGLYRAYKAGDRESALACQAEVAAYREGCYTNAYWLSSMKMAMHLLGLCGPKTTRPIDPVGAAHQKEIRQTLQSLGLI